MKKTLSVVAGITLLFLIAGVVYAYSERISSTTYTLPVIGENVEMEVRPALAVETKWTGIAVPFTGEPVSIFPGQIVGEGEITIENVSPILQAAQLIAQPIIVVEGWPLIEVTVTDPMGVLLYRPWELISLAPGEKIEIFFQVKVAYGSQLSVFRGLELLIINTVPPPPPPPPGGLG